MTKKIKKYHFYYTTEINLESNHAHIFSIADFFIGTRFAVFSSKDQESEAKCVELIDKFLVQTLEKLEQESDAFLVIISEFNKDYYPGKEDLNFIDGFEDDEMCRFILVDEFNEDELCCLTVKVKRATTYYDYDVRIVH